MRLPTPEQAVATILWALRSGDIRARRRNGREMKPNEFHGMMIIKDGARYQLADRKGRIVEVQLFVPDCIKVFPPKDRVI